MVESFVAAAAVVRNKRREFCYGRFIEVEVSAAIGRSLGEVAN